MKKIIILLLALSVVGSLAACGAAETPPVTENSVQQVEPTPTKPIIETEPVQEEIVENDHAATKTGDVVYEDDNVVLVFDYWHFVPEDDDMFVSMKATNKLDKEVSICTDKESVNAWTMLGFEGSEDIPAHETVDFVIGATEGFAIQGITALEDIKEFSFELSISADEQEDVVTQLFLHPTADREYTFVGKEENEGDIVLVDYVTDEGQLKLIYAQNHLERDRVVYMDYYGINTMPDTYVIEFVNIHIGEEKFFSARNMTFFHGNKEMWNTCSVWAEEDAVSVNDTISFDVLIRETETYQPVYQSETPFVIQINKTAE